MDRNKVILVDEYDDVIGQMDKLVAHKLGQLHRAFSIFVFNSNKQLLMQQRASHKYHGANLWTNTCCSHPQLGERVEESAMERLNFEMGMQCNLHFSHAFIYHAKVENELIEHEYDHVFIGYSDSNPIINSDEVQDYKWIDLDLLQEDIQLHPTQYTYWFKEALPLVIQHIDLDKS